MKAYRQSGKCRGETGSALLIAIFALLLISVVGIALLVSTGSDSALAGNYRTSTATYYAAVAGLEEGRGRLLSQNPNFIGNTLPNFVPAIGGPPLDVHNVLYILNPNAANGEVVNPTDLSSPYADKEYGSEFTWQLSGATVQTIPSVSSIPALGLSGPLYKWVRINAVTAAAINVDVSSAGPPYNSTTQLYYNGTGLSLSSAQNVQALEVTAFAYMPDKSTKYLQYVVAPIVVSSQLNSPPLGSPPNINFPAALTLVGNNVTYTGPNASGFSINGQDQSSACSTANYMVPSIGFTSSGDSSNTNILAGAMPPSSYSGYPPTGGSPPQPSTAPASIQDVSASMSQNWLTPAALDNLAQNVTNNADVVINGNATGTEISSRASAMSAANPMTVVVNGNLDLNAWHNTGYGMLLVTGTLFYDPDATWEGLVLVIGQGSFVSTKSGTGGIDGAVVIAKTRDPSGNLLPSLGAASFSQTGSGANVGRGINYNSCLVKSAAGPLTYKVLSFREIAQ